MRRFYAEPANFRGKAVTLSPDEARHLRDVLRLRDGRVRVFNGEGGEFLAEIESVQKSSATLRIIEQLRPSSPESKLHLTLAAGVLKGEKFDLVVQKSVELGAVRLVPLITARCDVKLKDGSRRAERWRKIALEASKQSGRATLMTIDEPTGLADLLRLLETAGGETALMFAERDGGKLPDAWSGNGNKITALIGPEGGWEDVEIELARSAGCAVVTLGGRIMRAETAGIAIAAILQHRFGDLC